MDEKIINRLAKLLAVQSIFISVLQSSFEQFGFPKEKMLETLQVAFQHLIAKEEQRFYQLLTTSTLDAHDDLERDLWNQLGLGDLWKPSTPSDPEDRSSDA